jgi:hypothetical protein
MAINDVGEGPTIKPKNLRFGPLSLTNELFNCYRDDVGRVVMDVVTGVRKSEPSRDSHCRCALLHDLRKVSRSVRLGAGWPA